MPSTAIGRMREQLVVERNDPPTLSVSSLTRTASTATLTTATPHGYLVGDYITVAGSTIAGWNAKVKVVTVPTPTTLTYAVSSGLATPATGTITVIYTSNASGGVIGHWRTIDTIPAEMIPLGAMERLQIQAVQSSVTYRFRVRVRADLTPKMQCRWTPSWPPGVPEKTLAISGIVPMDDGRTFQFIECSEVAA